MEAKDIKVGMLVVMPKRPDWGPGKVLEVREHKVKVFFRDAPKPTIDEAVKTLDLRVAVLEPAHSQTDPRLDNLPMRDGNLALVRPPLTLDQAVEAFLQNFPQGFEDPGYLGDKKTGERFYKWQAHERYVELLGRGVGESLLRDGEVDEVVRRGLRVVGPLNLADQHEQMAFFEGLKDRAAAREYFEAVFKVVAAVPPERASFERLIRALEGLPIERGRVANWPNLTMLPYVARPDAYMLLKPGVTQDAAAWLAFDLAYDSKLNWTTYERLMALGRVLADALKARNEPALVPQDFIDVQSFIWVVGFYGAPRKN